MKFYKRLIPLFIIIVLIISCLIGCTKEPIKVGFDKNTDYYHITETLRVDNKLGEKSTDDRIVVEGYSNVSNDLRIIYTDKFEKFYCNSTLLAVYTKNEVCVVDISTNEIIKTVPIEEFESEYNLDDFMEYDL